MKKWPWLLFLLVLPSVLFSQERVDVPVQVTRWLSSAGEALESDTVAAVLADVFVGDSVVIAAGTPVQCNINRSRARALGEEGRLTLDFVRTTDVQGRSVRLQRSISVSGRDREILAVGLGLGLGCISIVGFLALLIKGTEAEINPGTIIYVSALLNVGTN